MQPMDEYEALSRDYKNKVFVLDDIDAVVYVEGEVDEYFWKNVLEHVTPDKKYKFEFNSNPNTKDRNEYRSGSNECAKFYPYTDPQFIVCIDSDYNYLLDSHTFSDTDFVFQTYTYSIENHYCYAENMQAVIQHLTGQNTFNFDVFLTDYSGVVYDLFVLSVLSMSKNDGQLTIKDFENTCKVSRSFDLSDNGQNELDKLEIKVNAKLSTLKGVYTSKEIKDMQWHLSKKDMPVMQCYLFIKGHSLIDLDANKTGRPKVINNINDQLFKKYRRTTESKGVAAKDYIEYLRNTLDYTGYSQVQWLMNDLKRKL